MMTDDRFVGGSEGIRRTLGKQRNCALLRSLILYIGSALFVRV